MNRIAVITPTYAADFELCCDLHNSILHFTDDSVIHYLLVAPTDLQLFSGLQGPRCVVLAANELLPNRIVYVPAWVNHLLRFAWRKRPHAKLVALNLGRPIPPVRGWIMQQILKLAAATCIDADILLLVDSDVRLVRPVDVDTFVQQGKVRLYRTEGSINEELPRHVAWHKVANNLLGLRTPEPPLPDYVSAFNVWDRRVVLALIDQIERISRRHWVDVIAGQFDFSEHILYGVFVDGVLGPSANCFATSSSLCHSYWDTMPLDAHSAETFVESISADDVAILIQSKSGTPLNIRRSALARFS